MIYKKSLIKYFLLLIFFLFPNNIFAKSLKEFTKTEVARHNCKGSGIWVTYKNKVYDVTNFVDSHPGGEKILQAAGKAIDPFWVNYPIHHNQHVLQLLSVYLIGTLKDFDKSKLFLQDPYANEPERCPRMDIRSNKPFNAETPVDSLKNNFITPTKHHYVRHHMPVPKIDSNKYNLKISGDGLNKPIKNLNLSLDEIKNNFVSKKITMTMQCAGNRRSEMAKVKEVKGLDWKFGAISTAMWEGAALSDILQSMGVSEYNPEIKHVHFVGLDSNEKTNYEISIPIEIALDPRREVILAYKMNGEELPQDHGYPIRIVVPGALGAKSVKWLGEIKLSKIESQSIWQQKAYKTFNSSKCMKTADFDNSLPLLDMPVQSAIFSHKMGDTLLLSSQNISVSGYAWSGGGRSIKRVEVSYDNGKSWRDAKLIKIPQKYNRAWAWTLWQIYIPTLKLKGKQKATFVVKAIDSANNVQPESVASIWNYRGLVCNAWHKVKVNIAKEK